LDLGNCNFALGPGHSLFRKSRELSFVDNLITFF
jgi:hypothetical protein